MTSDTPHTEDGWGELRSMLDRPRQATREQWLTVLAHIATFHQEERDAAALYAARTMCDAPKRWPASACSWRYTYRERIAPESWQTPLIRSMEVDTVSKDNVDEVTTWLSLEGLSLEQLSLEWFEMSVKTLGKLMSATAITRLKSLHIKNYDSGAKHKPSIQALDGHTVLQTIERLSLRHVHDVASKTTGEILEQCSNLTSLGIHGGMYEKRSWERVFAGLDLPITHLDLSGSSCGSAAINVLIRHQVLDEIEAFSFEGHDDGTAALKSLSKANNQVLRKLDMSGTQLGAAGLRALEQALFLETLRTLRLAGNSLRPLGKSLTALRELGLCERLEELDLGSTGVGPKLAAPFIGQGMPEMRRLDLGNNGLGDAGVKTLVEAEMPHLTHLDVHWNRLSDSGLMALTRGRWPKLEHLRCEQYQREVAPEVIEALTERFGAGVVKTTPS